MKISVVIPTYNRSRLLMRALDSVLKQTYVDLEIIVVDDGSTDETERLIAEVADKRLRYIRQKNRGVANARNRGIEMSTGKWIAFLDSDDEWMPNKISSQIDALENSKLENVGFVSCFRRDVDVDGEIINDSTMVYRGSTHKNFLHNWMHCYDITNSSTILVKKNILEEVGLFDEDLSDNEDYDLWIRISKVCELEFVEDYLVNCYKWKSEARMSKSEYYKNKMIFFKKNFNDFILYPDVFEKKIIWLISYGLSLGKFKQSRELLGKALVSKIKFFFKIKILFLSPIYAFSKYLR